MIKVPCGGFYLDENFLGMNENNELSLVGGSEGKAYQYVVTDEDGNTQWEDRLAYDEGKLVVDAGSGMQFVKVSDEVPSWATANVDIRVWTSDGDSKIETPGEYEDFGNGSFRIDIMVFFVATDNFEPIGFGENLLFPEKGVYFTLLGGGFVYTTGIASADSDTPEITWDGNIGTLKTIDSKYIPSELNGIIIPSSTPGSSKKFKITVDDSGTISATEVTT